VSGLTRSVILHALRSATPFPIPESTLNECVAADPDLVHGADRIGAAESVIKAALLNHESIPAEEMPASLPVLGNIAEAVVESMLADYGWQPVYDDVAGISFGHGVDLLMLDPALERMVAVEVKSTIQPARWPRLARGRNEQLTQDWFNHPRNQGMFEWELTNCDIYAMVVQVHFRRLLWRSCIARDLRLSSPIADTDQLADLSWLSEHPSRQEHSR
jgi:hypothetical protein